MKAEEWLALWYLRLNGYFVNPNFYAHDPREPMGEIDVFGVRFPHSKEDKFDDDPQLKIPSLTIDIVFAEAKEGHIRELNRPWRDPTSQLFEYALRRVGVVSHDQVDELAKELYSKRCSTRGSVSIRIIVFAKSIGQDLQRSGVIFVDWNRVLAFIYKRFTCNWKLKADHSRWDRFGNYLWNACRKSGKLPPEPGAFFKGWDGE